MNTFRCSRWGVSTFMWLLAIFGVAFVTITSSLLSSACSIASVLHSHDLSGRVTVV